MEATQVSITSEVKYTPKISTRLISLDALRGFDMFWIISGEEIFHGIANVVQEKHSLTRNPENWRIADNGNLSLLERIAVGISNQLHHSLWNGFTFYDLIFPLFIFIAGISMPFSYSRYLSGTELNSSEAKKKLYISLLKRTLLLILFGMIVNGLLKFQEYENTRFASVLGRIGLACFFAAVIYLNSSLRMELFWFFVILTGYWALITLVPVPHYGAGVLSPGKDLSAWVDQQFLPGKLHRKIFDPEGLLSTIPAIATAMLGIFTGQFLRWNTSKQKPAQKMLFMLAAAALLICTGLIWDIFFPINKTIWSSSFVLYAGGWSLLLFALFYGIIDVAEYKKWAQPFVWIGTNSILIYMAAHGLVNFESTSQFLFGGIAGFSATSWQHVIIWTGVLFLQLVLLRFLYKRKLFLKI